MAIPTYKRATDPNTDASQSGAESSQMPKTKDAHQHQCGNAENQYEARIGYADHSIKISSDAFAPASMRNCGG